MRQTIEIELGGSDSSDGSPEPKYSEQRRREWGMFAESLSDVFSAAEARVLFPRYYREGRPADADRIRGWADDCWQDWMRSRYGRMPRVAVVGVWVFGIAAVLKFIQLYGGGS